MHDVVVMSFLSFVRFDTFCPSIIYQEEKSSSFHVQLGKMSLFFVFSRWIDFYGRRKEIPLEFFYDEYCPSISFASLDLEGQLENKSFLQTVLSLLCCGVKNY